MKLPFEKNLAEVTQLEDELATRIENISQLLESPVEDRDFEGLERQIWQASHYRRRLAGALKTARGELNLDEVTGSLNIKRAKAAKMQLKRSSAMLRLWSRFEPLLMAQIHPTTSELVDVGSYRPIGEATVLQHVEFLFSTALHRAANPKAGQRTDDATEHGCHHDIPLPMTRFSNLISSANRVCLALRKDKPLKFLDVGSGGGTKVLAATTCFEVCHGLEYEESAVEFGRQFLDLVRADECSLIHGDALTFDKYADYDVIYYYRPLIETDKMQEMEAQILSQVKPKTVIVAVNVMSGGMVTEDLEAKDVFPISEVIYVTGTTPEEGQQLRERAEEIGLSVRGFGRKPLPKLGYWEPLQKVSARNGFVV